MIVRLGFTYLGSRADAEDVCQDVLIKLMLNAPEFSDTEHEKAWVLRTAINQCKDVLKSARRRTSVPLDADVADLGVASAEDEVLAGHSEVLQAVQRLPLEQRDAIYLHYYEDLKIKEIAKITHRSVAAVTMQLSRGRQAIRQMLERG